MVKIPVVFVDRALEYYLVVIMHLLHQLCNTHISSHKYTTPHYVSSITRTSIGEVGIGGAVIIDGVSGVDASEEGSGVPFGEGGKVDAAGGGDDVF